MQIYKNLSLETLPGEQWKTVIDYPSYEVSNLGRVKSFSKSGSQILKPSMHSRGYTCVSIANMLGRKTIKIHRLVGIVFLSNPNHYNEINHIDSDKTNNAAYNLEWCTRSHNMKHMLRSAGVGHRLGMSNPKATLVVHVDYGIICTMREAAFMSGFKEANFNNMMYETGYRKNRTKFIFA